MFLVTINKPKQLLHLSFIGQVRAEELSRHREDLVGLLAELSPGFRLLTDLDRLECLSAGCAAEIGRMMELFDQKGVDFAVRVVPDQHKDIGLNILSHFHYQHPPRTVTCANMVEAAMLLSL